MLRNENLILHCLILCFYLVLPSRVDISLPSQFEAKDLGLKNLKIPERHKGAFWQNPIPWIYLAETFYNVKYGSSIITSKSLPENLSNHNKHFCFCCLQDKTWIKMPKLSIFLKSHHKCLFWLLTFSDKLFDVINDDRFLTL